MYLELGAVALSVPAAVNPAAYRTILTIEIKKKTGLNVDLLVK